MNLRNLYPELEKQESAAAIELNRIAEDLTVMMLGLDDRVALRKAAKAALLKAYHIGCHAKLAAIFDPKRTSKISSNEGGNDDEP